MAFANERAPSMMDPYGINRFQNPFASAATLRQPDRENVQASQGAGAAMSPGQEWGSRLNQAGMMASQQQQQQSAAAAAAQLRGMNTPGGMDQWHQNMLQGMGQSMGNAVQASPWGQQMQQQANAEGATALRGMNTPGGAMGGGPQQNPVAGWQQQQARMQGATQRAGMQMGRRY